MELSPVPIGIGPVPGGGACNRELRRILLLRRWVNKPDRDHRQFIAVRYTVPNIVRREKPLASTQD